MNPAYSVIFFTVSSGVSFGVLMVAGALAAFGRLPGSGFLAFCIMTFALGTAVAGLLASTLHLGHPERAWRAFSQWRTSWLSREGIAALATFPPALIFGWGWVIGAPPGVPYVCAAALTAIMAFATVGCTGMIYQSLRTIRAWHDPLVTPIYLVLALATGALWLAFAARLAGPVNPVIAQLPFVTLVTGWLLKSIYWLRRDQDRGGPTASSATGLGLGGERVRLLESPHTQDNFVLREMGFKVARRHAVKLRRVAQALGFAVPLALTEALALADDILGPLGLAAALLAAICSTLGIAVERWLLFAEARHAVTLYYGAERA